MIVTSILQPIGDDVRQGELITFPRGGGPAIAVVTQLGEAGHVMVVILDAVRPEDRFAQKQVRLERTWGTYGTDWVLELIPGMATTRNMSRVMDAIGCITSTSGGLTLFMGGFDELRLHLDTWAIDGVVDYKGLVFSDWRIWATDAARTQVGVKPIIDWHLENLEALIGA